MDPTLLIMLPAGPVVSGITTWALRLARASDRVVLAVHDAPESVPLSGCRVVRLPSFGSPLEHVARYVGLLADLEGPVVVSPNQHEGAYALGACLSQAADVHLIGVHHSDTPYNDALLTRYEPMLSRLVGVSGLLAERLRAHLPHREGDILRIGYGVPLGTERGRRAPGPLRLLYMGRLAHEQKRIATLVHMRRALAARGIDATLTMLGDGPALDEMRATGEAICPGAVPADEVEAHLREADLFVMGSAYEGLSVAMLEAMAQGVAPVVTSVPGVEDVVTDGVSGILVPREGTDAEVGAALASGVERAVVLGVEVLGAGALRSVRHEHEVSRCAGRYQDLARAIVREPIRRWPLERPCASGPDDSVTVPADAPGRMRALLAALEGPVLIHGTGAHTLAIASVLATANVVGFADDDPARCGGHLFNWPIIPPSAASALGARHVVISSSIHEQAIWDRRSMYESQGLRVHRLYACDDAPSGDAARLDTDTSFPLAG
ncbi:MAG: glycosyltransferase family 4 protein [Phycisphaerales bacterium]|nr:glycosyltransferase family 4 protein [Phycisphaerales bacterium]